MAGFPSETPEVCVIGRTNFHTGIGRHTYAFAELFSRSYATCIHPTDGYSAENVFLPNGRAVPTWKGTPVRASIFVDVLWNGVLDGNIHKVPHEGLRLACVVWDSDELPAEWVRILNTRFDAAICLSPHLVELAKRDGVVIPCLCVPLALPLEELLREPVALRNEKVRIGSVSAFHPRKNTTMLVHSFQRAFGHRNDVQLRIHSNLAFSQTFSDVQKRLKSQNVKNISLSLSDMTEEEKNHLINSFDIFVNLSRGEGYSIGAREALAMGKTLVLSNVGGHQDLAGLPGVFLVEPELKWPARYPEIDNRVFGRQQGVTEEAAANALRLAYEYVLSDQCMQDAHERRKRAADFSMDSVSHTIGGLLDKGVLAFRNGRPVPKDCSVPESYFAISKSRLESSEEPTTPNARIIQMHDGGFFSLFNVFFSHLVWDMRDDRCHRVLPDWDVKRFLERMHGDKILSFCYGQPEDGNLWTQLFKPLFGLSKEQMQSEELLYHRAELPAHHFNESREPLLTYKHAAELYQSPMFLRFRRQYARVFREHIQLEDGLQTEIDAFHAKHMAGYTVLGAHVRHPSHTVEQPGAVIAHAEHYINALNALASERGLSRRKDNWRIFLATDQDRVLDRFREEYGDRVVYLEGLRRTTDKEDSEFDSLEDKNVDGYQLQHLVARDMSNWSVDMAREVIKDAYLMAKCSTLHHVVSNVSTAVSYINPDVNMYYNKEGRFIKGMG